MKKIALLAVIGLALISCQQKSGVNAAYVDNSVLRDNYKALERVNDKFESNMQALESEVQKEKEKFDEKVKNFQDNFQSMSESKAADEQKKLLEEQQRIQNAINGQESALREGVKASHDSLENVLKDKVKQYAKSKGYNFVFGLNEDLNILYAEDSKDITQDVLDELNKE